MKKLLLLLIIPFLSFGQILGCLDENACNYNPDATQDNASCDFCSCTDTSCTLIQAMHLSECHAFSIKNENNEIIVDFNLWANSWDGWCNSIGANPWDTLSINYCFSPGCYTLEIEEVCNNCPIWWDPSTFLTTFPGPPTIYIGEQEFFYQDDSFCEPIQFSFNGNNVNLGCDLVYVNGDTIYITDTLYIDNFITDTVVDIVYENYYIYDTIVETEYIDVVITEYVDCDTGLPCISGMAEIVEKSKNNGKIYNLLGQEIIRREGVYIEGGEIKYRF